ncbi:hypothetical protein [Leptolyngbya sp. 'hensonii']|uniref:hypothetical protein n=1 Tax=Leptolyngbya sp. 'hensonii' TaxID=1922337 RepID=UPI000AEDEF88|nr:hypothetical protein [Leptolyngbya sp. 'hensonii']
MPTVPDTISSRDLFWLWYDRLTLEQRKNVAQEFNRFVAQVELESRLQKILIAKVAPAYNEGWEDTFRR